MGMYDIVWVKLKCPRCGKTGWFDLQTKEGPRILAEYNLGDRFPLKEKTHKNRLIWLLGNCPNCKCFVEGCGWLDKNMKIFQVDIFKYIVHNFDEIIIKYKKGMERKKTSWEEIFEQYGD